MKSFFSSRISKFNALMTLCLLGVSTLSLPVIAAPQEVCIKTSTGEVVCGEPVQKSVDDRLLSKKFPDKFVGSWQGRGVQAGGGWSIAITLKPGEKKSVVGAINYASIPCSGELTLLDVDDQSIRLSENLTNLGTCVNNGIIVLKLEGSNKLNYQWFYSNGSLAATGSLQRVKRN